MEQLIWFAATIQHHLSVLLHSHFSTPHLTLMIRPKAPLVLSRLFSLNPLHPPSHFTNRKQVPRPYQTPETNYQLPSISNHGQYQHGNHSPVLSPHTTNIPSLSSSLPSSSSSSSSTSPSTSPSSLNSHPHENSIREITGLLAMFALAYIAIDNYTERMKLEKLHTETTAINLKALQVQQLNYQKERKKKDLQLLQERRELAKRNFKMALHIAMLRKQLLDAGMDPISLDASIAEFEKSVKADNSIKNVTGQYLWLDDSSGMFK